VKTLCHHITYYSHHFQFFVVSVTSCFGFPNNFAVIAMNYFDRVLSRSNALPNSKSEIQLLALSCFYLSVKLFQAGPILSTEQICMISGFVFVPSQIVEMEQKILRTLDWCLYPPTALEFLEPYLQILLCCNNLPLQFFASEILETAEEFVNEMTLDYYFIANQFLPSHIAVAALVNAIFTIVPNNKNTPTIHDLTQTLSQICDYRIDEQDVILCCERLLRLMNTSNEHNLDATMSDPYHTLSSAIPHDTYHTDGATPNSPVAVTSYATDFNYHTPSGHFVSTCRSMLPITSSNYCISFTRDYL
jgi:Cyclin, N-terminal domain/Cyclin, C-terminal domain